MAQTGYVSKTALAQVADSIKDYVDKHDAEHVQLTEVSATIGLTADGTGYTISLPWFRVEGGLITECGTKTFTVPQLFNKSADGSVIVINANS